MSTFQVLFFSGGFPQLLCCLCLAARTRCTTVRLRAAAGRRLVLAKNSALKMGMRYKIRLRATAGRRLVLVKNSALIALREKGVTFD